MSKTSRSWCVLYGLVLLQFFVSTASAEIILQTPAGLTEGEKFRFIFLTSGTTNAESADISYYNNFVNMEAQEKVATYDGNLVTWYAVASTADGTEARVNVGGLGDLVPTYLVTGVKVADSLMEGSSELVRSLWGTIDGYDLYSPVNVGIDGSTLSASDIWAGSGYGGTVSVALGNANPGYGYSGAADFRWILRNTSYGITSSTPLPMYAVSEELTANAVPEPGTLALTGVAGLLMFGRRIWRRLRPNRSRP